MTSQLTHVLDATRPQVLHVHNLLNLSFDLPRVARARGIATVATLHDYTLVCASGGQRVHVAESHVCHEIDTDRCSRCFSAAPVRAQMVLAGLSRAPEEASSATAASHRPQASAGAHRRRGATPADQGRNPGAIGRAAADVAREVFTDIDLFVAPSASLAGEYVRLGVDERRIEVSDYGFRPRRRSRATGRRCR